MGALDRLTVRMEVDTGIFSDDARDMNALGRKVIEDLRSAIVITPVVEFHEAGVLPVQEGKAIRVYDWREESSI